MNAPVGITPSVDVPNVMERVVNKPWLPKNAPGAIPVIVALNTRLSTTRPSNACAGSTPNFRPYNNNSFAVRFRKAYGSKSETPLLELQRKSTT